MISLFFLVCHDGNDKKRTHRNMEWECREFSQQIHLKPSSGLCWHHPYHLPCIQKHKKVNIFLHSIFFSILWRNNFYSPPFFVCEPFLHLLVFFLIFFLLIWNSWQKFFSGFCWFCDDPLASWEFFVGHHTMKPWHKFDNFVLFAFFLPVLKFSDCEKKE